MKKIISIILVAMMIFCTGCQGGIDFDVETKLDIKTKLSVDYSVQYIRTDGYPRDTKFPQTAVIKSKQELDSYYENNKNVFNLERKDKVYSDTTIGFLDACDKYGDEFFEENNLVFVILEEPSGSNRHKLNEINLINDNSDKSLEVNIETISPEVGTCDMAAWHIILEIEKDVIFDKVNVKTQEMRESKDSLISCKVL